MDQREPKRSARPTASSDRPSPSKPWPDGWRHQVAGPAFDSRAQPGFVGLRAATTAVDRRLFRIEGCEIDLELTRAAAPAGVRVVGQVTLDDGDPGGGWLRLARAYDQQLTLLDESGEFRLDDLVPGNYRLEVVLKDRLIEVPELAL